MKKVKDLKWGMEYEYDEVNKRIFKTLICHHTDGTLTEEKLEYEYIAEKFTVPYTEKEFEEKN